MTKGIGCDPMPLIRTICAETLGDRLDVYLSTIPVCPKPQQLNKFLETVPRLVTLKGTTSLGHACALGFDSHGLRLDATTRLNDGSRLR